MLPGAKIRNDEDHLPESMRLSVRMRQQPQRDRKSPRRARYHID
jgi:hypothetical protein